jgi:phosphohistidine phosphatase
VNGMNPQRVYLVRHARAEGSAPTDAARRLTPGGREEFARHARALLPRLQVTRILASPFVRAAQTADLLAEALGQAPVAPEPRLASGASGGREVLALAARAGDGAALVGHNPEMAEAILLAAGKAVEVPPGTVAAVDLEGETARLAWLAAP